jgi:NADP-dependent 3-hydroxy acid dehydrogenase YdfG
MEDKDPFEAPHLQYGCTADELRIAKTDAASPIASHKMLHAEEVAEAVPFALSGSHRRDIAGLRIDPVLQTTA